MKKFLLSLLLTAAAFLAPQAKAQGFRYDNIALNQNGQPIVNANVRVCAGDVSSGPVPCSTPTTIYSDQALTVPLAQPIHTGPLGNYGFFIAPGVDTISFFGTNITGVNNILTIPCTTTFTGCSGGSNPVGNVGDIQDKVNGTTLGASHINDGGTVANQLTASENMEFINDAIFKSGKPWYDVTAFGAKCDMVNTGAVNGTDDTAAFAAAVSAAIAGGGIVYVPRPAGNTGCRINLSALNNPTSFFEWLYILDDGPILATGTISNTRLIAVVGRQGFFQTGGGDFATTPSVGWAGQTFADSALAITGSTSLYFEGINFAPANHGSSSAATVQILDAGASSATSNVAFVGDAFGSTDCPGNHNVSIINTAMAGNDFNISFSKGSQFGCDSDGNAIYMKGLVSITVGDPSMTTNFDGGGVYIDNTGGTGGFYTGGTYNNILFESVGHALFTIGQANQLAGLWLDNISDADPTATPYILKTVSNDLRDLQVRGTAFTSPGSGGAFFDPASSGNIVGVNMQGCGGCYFGMTAGSAALSGFIIPPSFGHNSGEVIGMFTRATSDAALALAAPNDVLRFYNTSLGPPVTLAAKFTNATLECPSNLSALGKGLIYTPVSGAVDTCMGFGNDGANDYAGIFFNTPSGITNFNQGLYLQYGQSSITAAHDILGQFLAPANGWAVLQQSGGLGFALATANATPVIIRPNNIETARFLSGGGLTLESGSLTLSGISGSTQCLHVNSSGVVSGTGSDCGSGGGSGINITVNGGSNLVSPANFQSGPAYDGITINALNPSGSNVDFQLSGVATEAFLPATTVFTDQSATFGAHTYDLSAASVMKIPVGAGLAPTANGSIGYDSTANKYVFGQNGATVSHAEPGTCTNQVITVTSATAGPTCTTITSAYVNNSIALTGTDINTSNQVTATHLASALPINQGGTGTTSTLTGLVRGSGSAMTAAELSGDATTSGSNVVTVVKVDGVSYPSGPSTHSVPVITASNTATYKVITDCNGASNALNYTQSTDAFSCNNISTLSNPMTTLGDLLYGGAAGAATRLAGPTGPNGIPQTVCETPSAGAATAEVFCVPGVAIDAQTGTTFTVPITDDVHFITGNNASATAWTGFTLANNYAFSFQNLGAGLITYTPASGTVNGGSTQIIPQYAFGFHYTDNTNTFMPVMPTLQSFPSCADSSGNHLNFTTATGLFSCGTSTSGADKALDNLASVNINTSLLAQTGVDLGSTTKPFRNLFLFGAGTYSSTYIELTSTPTSTRTITIQDASYTVIGRDTTDTLTNKTYDTSGTGNVLKVAGTQITAIAGNTGTLGTTSGAFTSGNCVKSDANHNFVDSGGACGGGGGTPCTTTGNSIQYDNAGSFGCLAEFTYASSTITSSTAGKVDLSAATGTAAFKVPSNTTNTATAAGTIDYDSTHTNLHSFIGGADAILTAEASAVASGFLVKSSSATVGLLTATLCDEGITTANTLTCTDTAGLAIPKVAVGTSPPTCTAGTAGAQCFGEGTPATAVSSVDDLHGDSTQKALEVNNNNTGEMAISRTACVNVTPVTVAANVTSDQLLQACSFSANLLNVVGRTLRVDVAGVFSTAAASTASLTFKVKLCTVSGCGSGTVITPISTATGATAALTASNLSFGQTSLIVTQTAGASSAYEAHGSLRIDLSATAATPDSVYQDTNTATVGTIDSTGAIFLQVTVAASAGSTSNSFTERQLVVEVLN